MLNTNYKLNKFHCATSTKAVLATQINFFFFLLHLKFRLLLLGGIWPADQLEEKQQFPLAAHSCPWFLLQSAAQNQFYQC